MVTSSTWRPVARCSPDWPIAWSGTGLKCATVVSWWTMPDTEAHSNSAGQRSQASLAGLRVVEFDQIIAGPMAGTLLADLGAEVIHIELPGVGEAGRSIGPSK